MFKQHVMVHLCCNDPDNGLFTHRVSDSVCIDGRLWDADSCAELERMY